MVRALGICVHTGWAACVVVEGTRRRACILTKARIEIVAGPDRFCYHRASALPAGARERWLTALRRRALGDARRALAPLLARGVDACAIVAREGEAGPIAAALEAHPRIHTAEGCFYRDVIVAACGSRAVVVPPAALDPSKAGAGGGPPWGRDQKLAALAARRLLRA
jgi:hypothetical protein